MPKAPSKPSPRTATLLPPLPKIDPHNVDALNDLPQETLKALWIAQFGHRPPAKGRRTLLIDCLAYSIQEQAFGGLSFATRAKLRKLANDVLEGRSPVILTKTQIKPGTRLVRAWGGETHEVQVLEGGFSYRGENYPHLSGIAKVITGARWSGPLFFGIRKRSETKEGSTHG